MYEECRMSLTIDLSKEVEAALAAQATAAQLPTERYVAELIEDALQRRRMQAAHTLEASLDDIAGALPPETTREQMETALEEALLAVRPRRHWAQ
jgi:hypothetical protein